jgi:uncharacterized protein (TIGR02246 family)
MKKRWIPVAAAGLVTAAFLGLMATQGRATDDQKNSQRPADAEAIRKTMQSFLAAFESGDAKAVAAYWTTGGEYSSKDGTVIRGRAAIEKAYTESFAKKKKAKVEPQVDSLRFPSRDTAIEEGRFTVRREGEAPIASRYSLLLVREDGKWLIAELREWPTDEASLQDLSWLIGTWAAKRDDMEVRTTYEWWGKKAFIRATFTIKSKDETVTGFQMIGKDSATGRLRSWTYEEDGDFGEADWGRNGDKWVLDAAGVLANGSTVTAKNIFTQVDKDSFTWQSVARTVDDEALPDTAPIKVTRVAK